MRGGPALELLRPWAACRSNPGCPAARRRSPGRLDGGWSCPEHGAIAPLWRPDEASYDAFVEHLGATAAVPDVPALAAEPGLAGHRLRGGGRTRWRRAGGDDLRLGHQRARRAGRRAGGQRGGRHRAGLPRRRHRARRPGRRDRRRSADGPRARSTGQAVPLWPVSTSDSRGEWDRSVVAGEARRPLAVDGPAPGLGDPAAARRLDPARRLRLSARRWSSCRSGGPRRRAWWADS